jgi:TolB protein
MNADGSGLTRLTDNSDSDLFPAWSPDGRHIAFTTDRDGNDEVYIMNADGSGQTNPTNDPDSAAFPVWLPVPPVP